MSFSSGIDSLRKQKETSSCMGFQLWLLHVCVLCLFNYYLIGGRLVFLRFSPNPWGGGSRLQVIFFFFKKLLRYTARIRKHTQRECPASCISTKQAQPCKHYPAQETEHSQPSLSVTTVVTLNSADYLCQLWVLRKWSSALQLCVGPLLLPAVWHPSVLHLF